MKKHLDRLGRPDAISWVTAVVTLVLVIPSNLISSLVDITDREIEFLGIVMLRVLIMLGVFALGRSALVFFAKHRPQPLITMGTFLAAIVIATTIFDFLLVVTGFAEEFLLAKRLRTTLAGSLTVLILTSLLVTYARDFSRSNSQLLVTLEKLRSAKAEAGERILARQDQLISTIRDSINAELGKFGGANPVADTTVMQNLIDDVVRPLSYSLNRDFPVDENPESPPPDSTIDWARVFRGAFGHNPFRMVAFPVGIGLISASFLIVNFGASGILATVALLGISTLMFWAFGWAWQFVPSRLTAPLRALIFSAAHLPPAGASTWAVTTLTGFNVLEPVRLWSFVVISLLISWTVTLVSATLRLLRDTNTALTTAVEELKREVIAINTSYRQLHKGISRLLHGPIQEAITSSMLRLKTQSANLEASDYAEIIRERITAALELLNTPAIPSTDLRAVLLELEELWRGVVTINHSVSERDLEIIGADLMSAYAVAELVREACSNATRHGQADQIDISLRVLPKKRAIELVVLNDGNPISKTSQPGIGSQLFDEQTLSWSRKQVGSRVRLVALLPLSSQKTTVEVIAKGLDLEVP